MIPNARSIIFPAVVTAVVAASVIAAIVTLGPPSAQRQRKMDEVRVQHLTFIVASVNGYFIRHKALPADLTLLGKEPGYHVARTDPATGKPYEYHVLGAASYRLCSNFAGDSATDSPQPYAGYVDEHWAHGAGHQCFDRNTEKNVPLEQPFVN